MKNAAQVLITCLVAVATAAPLAENSHNLEQAVEANGDNSVQDRAKRAKEEIIFGNQQNGARPAMAKKSVPEVEESPRPVPIIVPAQDVHEDKSGVIYASAEQPVAQAAESKPETKGDKTESETILTGKDTLTPEGTKAAPVIAAVEPLHPPDSSQNADAEEVLQSQPSEHSEGEPDDVEKLLKDIREENQSAGQSEIFEQKTEKEFSENSAGTQLQEMTPPSNTDDAMNEDEYSNNLLRYILLNEGRSSVPYNLPYPPAYYFQRRRRSLMDRQHVFRQHINRSRNKELIRAKRTKRDLYDDDLYYTPEELSQYQRPAEDDADDVDIDDTDINEYLRLFYPSVYNPSYYWLSVDPALESYYRSIQPYQNPWESRPRYRLPVEWEEPQEYEELEEAEEEPEDYDLSYPSEESSYEVPVKRQMLSLVPGNRRKRYFFPFAREPYTHWGAFVPSQEKRDYEDAYRRLRELSMVLADSDRPNYIDRQDYRRK